MGVLIAGAIAMAGAGGDARTTLLRDGVLRTCSPVSSYRALKVEKYQRACVISLRHSIDGVVECALRDAMMMKIAQPDADARDIKKEIDRLTTEGRTAGIRYRAWLARQVYENPSVFVKEGDADFFTAEEAFGAVAHRLEEMLLAAQQ
jgi:hypothetical protein